MKKYNCQDVVSTLKLYLRLRPWIEGHPNLGVYDASDKPLCPKCGSEHLQRRGVARKQQGMYARFQCTSCGGWSRGKMMELPLKKRRNLLVPE
jgi:predicted RNA-binding Zn-ribbon protein involved in translation (DUF1610 family)